MPKAWRAYLIYILELLFTVQTVLHSRTKILGGHKEKLKLVLQKLVF